MSDKPTTSNNLNTTSKMGSALSTTPGVGEHRTPGNCVVIGLTGGIATGKSTVSKLLGEKAQAVTLDADKFGHQAYLPGTKCLEELVAKFGDRILNKEDGTVDRKVLGSIVFSEPDAMQSLNKIVWPAIHDLLHAEIFKVAKEASAGEVKVIVVEAAVMIEAEWMDLVDELWVVTTPVETAKARLMERNQLDEEAALARINSQITNEERRAVAQVEIPNDSDQAALEAAIAGELSSLEARYSKLSALEMIDIVDEQDQVLYAAKRAVARSFNLILRCTYVVLVHAPSGKIYVQKRSTQKDFDPGLLDPAPGGVVSAGESYQANAEREMSEEMGLTGLRFKHVSAMWCDVGPGRAWGTIFTAKIDVDVQDLVLQESEVESVSLLSVEEILAMDPEQVSADGMQAFKIFVSKQTNA